MIGQALEKNQALSIHITRSHFPNLACCYGGIPSVLVIGIDVALTHILERCTINCVPYAGLFSGSHSGAASAIEHFTFEHPVRIVATS